MAAPAGETLGFRLAGLGEEPLTWLWPEHRAITKNELLTELQEKTAIPGVLPTFLQPIQTRLVMLQTGFRAMMGVKIFSSDLKEIERIGLEIEQLLLQVPGATDVVADRIVGKPCIPLAQVLTIKSVLGPQEIKGERGLLVGYVACVGCPRNEPTARQPPTKW